jgi:hypothetical protein
MASISNVNRESAADSDSPAPRPAAPAAAASFRQNDGRARGHVYIRGMREKRSDLVNSVDNLLVVNATSKSKVHKWRQLSPFYLGPYDIPVIFPPPGPAAATAAAAVTSEQTTTTSDTKQLPPVPEPESDDKSSTFILKCNFMENAWQFSKCYKTHCDAEHNPGPKWLEWVKKGFASDKPHRFPAGRGAKPEYSYFNGKKYLYIESRHSVYAPLYAEAVQKTAAFAELKSRVNAGQSIVLLDYDGYNHEKYGIALEDTMYFERRIWGHAFVLAMLLMDCDLPWEKPFDPSKIMHRHDN